MLILLVRTTLIFEAFLVQAAQKNDWGNPSHLQILRVLRERIGLDAVTAIRETFQAERDQEGVLERFDAMKLLYEVKLPHT